MKNRIIGKLQENFNDFLGHDDIKPPIKYGITPPGYMVATDPRFDKRPNRSSTMGPNPQAGKTIHPHRRERLDDNQEYAEYLKGSPLQTGVTGTPGPKLDTGFYREDDREPPVDISGKRDFQSDPKSADPDVRSATFGFPIVDRAGAESVFDKVGGPWDRDVTEVLSPVVYGDLARYQASIQNYQNYPDFLLGGSGYAPRPSQFVNPQSQNHNHDKEHPNQEWIQPHPNAMTHTIGHDHPFGHKEHYHTPVEYSTVIGDRGARLVSMKE